MAWLGFDSNEWLTLILDSGFKSVFVLLVAWLLTVCLRKSSAAHRHFVWFIALVGILVLPLASFLTPNWPGRFSKAENSRSFPQRASSNTSQSLAVLPENSDGEWDTARMVSFKGQPLASLPASMLHSVRVSGWSGMLVFVWFGGVSLFIALLVAGLLKLRHLRSKAVCVESQLAQSFRTVSNRSGVKKNVLFLQADGQVMPMTWGIKTPAIILPEGFNEWPRDRQNAVLLHELAHIKRADCLMHVLGWCVCAVYWFNPLAWLALRRMRVERERACDDLVIEGGAKASDYADHLLQIARQFRHPGLAQAAAMAMARASQLEGRLLAVLDEHCDRRGLRSGFSVAAIFIGAVAVVLISGAKTSYAFDEARAILFDDKVEFATGTNPSDLARGDLDGDGRPDLVVVNYFADTLSILRNISSGDGKIEYAERIDLPTDKNPITANLRDVDGDGKLDLVIANHFSKSIYIYRNTSQVGVLDENSFAAPIDIETEAGPCNAIARDLNNDGRVDLLVANNGHAKGNTISIFENIGGPGEIAFGRRINLRVGIQPTFVRVADWDGDGRPDIAVSNNLSYSLLLLRNVRGRGALNESSFGPALEFSVGEGRKHPYRIVPADMDGDGIPDLVVGSPNSLFIYRNTSLPGKFSFGAEVEVPSGSDFSVGLAVGDLNFDGKLDVAVGHLSTNLVSIFYNASVPGYIGAESFAHRQDLVAADGSSGVSIGDLDGDGRPDLAVANERASTISVFRNLVRKR